MIKNDLVLRAARRERTERTPVWLMRQAGRFDPQYRSLRERSGLTLEDTFRHPELAAEISLLPRRLGVDAIIFFQDILTLLTPMGAPFVFRPGPILESPVRTRSDVHALRMYDPRSELEFVARELGLVRGALDGELPLLGFAGAPLTLAFFLIEGKSPGREPSKALAFMRTEPALCHQLLDRLTDITVEYLSMQIEAGADAVQLFESVADLVSPAEYEQFAHPYHVKIFARLERRVPTILFVKEQPFVGLMAASGADVASVGKCVDLVEAKRDFGDRIAFQGNVDNRLLLNGCGDEIEQAVHQCMREGEQRGHILNLNHGLLQGTPFENVRRFIEAGRTGPARLEPDPAAAR